MRRAGASPSPTGERGSVDDDVAAAALVGEAAREVGADASFVEAPDSLEQLAEIGRRAEGPLVANMKQSCRCQ